MNFLPSARNRLAAARKDEGGFGLAELMVAISLLAIFVIINLNFMGTVYPAIVTPMIQNASGTDLKPSQVAAQRIYKQIQAFKDANPDTTPNKAALISGGYVNEAPEVVWAFHTIGSPASPTQCVIAYISNDASSDYTQSHPASYDSAYQSKTLWQACKSNTGSNNTLVPNWDSE